jgi:hypothetical protein
MGGETRGREDGELLLIVATFERLRLSLGRFSLPDCALVSFGCGQPVDYSSLKIYRLN